MVVDTALHARSVEDRGVDTRTCRDFAQRPPAGGSGAVACTVGPSADAHAVAGPVGEGLACRGRAVNDTAACGERSDKAPLDVLAGNRHIDVHRVLHWLGFVKILHPHPSTRGRGVDGMVVVQLGVPENGPPEANIDGLRVRRERELDVLRAGAICGSSMLSGDD